MRRRFTSKVVFLLPFLAFAACTDDQIQQPVEPSPVQKDVVLHFDFRFSNQEGGGYVKRLEYADENGNVVVVSQDFTRSSIWARDLALKTGDRIYMRAEVEFESVLWAVVQVSGTDVYYDDECESADGPSTCVVELDRIVE